MFSILTTGFYALGIFPLLFELGIILDPYKYLGSRLNMLKQLETVKEKNAAGEPIGKIELEKDFKKQISNQIKYFIWGLIGLFTHLSLYFIVLFIVGFITSRLIKKATGFKAQAQIIRYDALISAITIAFILVKHFF